MVASVFPLAQVTLWATDDEEADGRGATGAGHGDVPGLDDLPFIPGEASGPSSSDGAVSTGQGGTSSRPGSEHASPARADASGSVLLSQIIGAANLVGYDVSVPELPVDKLAPQAPLRAAILAWVAATGSQVAPDELARELDRADALPEDLQRDIALLLLSSIEATVLQNAALAKLTDEQLSWIYANPDVADDLSNGVRTPETQTMMLLASLVDMKKSIEASLLMLQAVEVTRGTFERHEAQRALDSLPVELDATTRAMLALLLAPQDRLDDAGKVQLAAKLVAMGAGIDVPAPGPAPSFADALAALTAATHQPVSPAALKETQARADALPADLRDAVARLVFAQANAVVAASPDGLTPTSQSEALVALLVAVAQTLPTLEKYSLYWSAAPTALRMGEWAPETRVGWAAHHAALFTTSRGSLVDLTRATALLNGHPVPAVPELPQRSFMDAYLAAMAQASIPVNASMRAAVEDGASRLPPAARDAAAILLSGAAESARLQTIAFAALTKEEQDFLRFDAVGLDALYAKPDLSADELATLSRAAGLARLVDREALDASAVVAAFAAQEAQRILEGEGALKAQGSATPVATGFRGFLQRLVPFRTASAQVVDCQLFTGVVDTCGDDVLLRLYYPVGANDLLGGGVSVNPDPRTGSFGIGSDGFVCNERECTFPFDEANRELLVITGPADSRQTPVQGFRLVCRAVANNDGTFSPSFSDCRTENPPRYGAPTVSLDLGGKDTYLGAVGMVHQNATLPVSIHLDRAGDDVYADPSILYDGYSPLLMRLGERNGHPTAGAAPFGGVALSVDLAGTDNYAANTRSQGYGRLGFGALIDLGGTTDIYRARLLSQGAASDTFTLGAGLLFDNGGNDQYESGTGHGYGLGGVLLDIGGRDNYRNDQDPLGAPFVGGLDIVPGGNVTTLHVREDNRVWLDGPGTLSAGIGIDTETVPTNGDADSDIFPDFAEFLLATDHLDRDDNPITNPTKRIDEVLDDTDRDGYPDYVERALSSDPNRADSYPAGFPAGPGIVVPAPIFDALAGQQLDRVLGLQGNTLNPFSSTGNQTTGIDGFHGNDKIVDLRLPLQDAGKVTYACTGETYLNSTTPVLGSTLPVDESARTAINSNPSTAGLLGTRDNTTNAPVRDSRGQPLERCVFVSYETSGPGKGSATVPTPNATLSTRRDFTFNVPVGILAIGDVIDTRYAEDYFVVIDLGGRDQFDRSAGGALAVVTTPVPQQGQPDDPNDPTRITFLAPSLAISVDLDDANAALASGIGNDRYANASQDYAHGAAFGVLLDTDGNDHYEARDGSQGSLGGVLLDLGGADNYVARDLSQGAGLAGETVNQKGLPAGSSGSDRVGPNALGNYRRAMPGMLLDLGTHTGQQNFTAGSHSQGFARGVPNPISTGGTPAGSGNARNATNAYGLLASLGGPDRYQAVRNVQGVGGGGGVGILLDTAGSDAYIASGLSHGATISQVIDTDEFRSQAPTPAVGILMDLEGSDAYIVNDDPRSVARQNTMTLHRAESASNSSQRFFLDAGLHLDAELDPTDPETFVAGVGGAGTSIDNEEFEVHLPTARLAIGKAGKTHYTREYAFVVDLGGANVYNYSAAGLIRDYVVQAASGGGTGNPGESVTATNTQSVPIFPVTFLLDAGRGDSNYTAPQGLAQGAGFFSVGVLADLGGRDLFTSLQKQVPALKSTWVVNPPSIDGTIGVDWDAVEPQPIALAAIREQSTTSDWQIRVANDNKSIYVALEGPTRSRGDELRKDMLFVDLDMGRRMLPWDPVANRTGIDEVRFSFAPADGQCVAQDFGHANARDGQTPTNQPSRNKNTWFEPDDAEPATRETKVFQGACRYTEEGRVFFEFRKDLIEAFPRDPRDLGYCYVEGVGFGYNTTPSCTFPANELGIFVEFRDAGAGWTNLPARFTWPAGATREDGDFGTINNTNLSDEMAAWGVLGLADVDKPGIKPVIVNKPSLSQGAAIAGVGILAMLGNGASESTLIAGDRAQAFASQGGFAFLLDVGGSDRYEGTRQVQGAARDHGVAFLIDFEGNDNYLSRHESLGWGPALPTPGAGSGGAIFLDLAGDDQYGFAFTEGQRFEQARGANQDVRQSNPARGNDIAWTQNTTGMGADYRVVSAVREALAGQLAQQMHNQTATRLSVTKYDPDAPHESRYANGCTLTPVPASATGQDLVNGKVCFIATVNTGNGTLNQTSKGPLDSLQALGQASTMEALGLLRNGTDGTANGRVNVTAVDFVLGRHRLATALDASERINKSVSRWSAVVDLSDFEDGIVRAKAVPIFTANLSDDELLVFSDNGNNPATEDKTDPLASIRTLMVNNPPRVGVSLAPAYTGLANATYSSLAYGAAQSLYVNYSVSHDAGEDRLNAHNNWKAPLWNTSLPCESYPTPGSQPTLCNQLPLYLHKGDKRILSTKPGPSEVNMPDAAVTESIGGPAHDQATENLKTDLYIKREESFHLALPSRVALIPGIEYVTYVKVLVQDENGVSPKVGTAEWVLGGGTFNKTSDLPAAQNLAAALGPAEGQLKTALTTVATTLAGTRGNVAWNTVNNTYATTCATNSLACSNAKGDLGTTPARPCVKSAPSLSSDTVAWLIWYPVNSYDKGELTPQRVGTTTVHVPPSPVALPTPIAGQKVCRDIQGEVNSTAWQLNATQAVTGAVADVGDLPTINPSGGSPNGLNFTDFWFDVTDTLPDSPAHADIRWGPDGTIIIPEGYRIVLKFGLKTPGGGEDEAGIGSEIIAAGNQAAAVIEGAATGVASCPDPRPEPPASAVCTLLLDNSPVVTVARQFRQTVQGIGTNLDTLLPNVAGVPASVFFVESGPHNDMADQARLEVRVPAEPTTRVSISIDRPITNEKVLELMPETNLVGDSDGTPTRKLRDLPSVPGRENDNPAYWQSYGMQPRVNYTINALFPERWTNYNLSTSDPGLEDGLYRVNVTATDDVGSTSRTDTLLLDRTAPQTFVTTDAFLSKGALVGGANIPARWSIVEMGSGIREVYLFHRSNESGDVTDMKTWNGPIGPFQAGVRSHTVTRGSENVHLLLTVGVDRANNTEGTTNELNFTNSIEAAFRAKINAGANTLGGYKRVTIDEGMPRFSAFTVDGGRLVADFQGSEFRFLRAGEPVHFGVCVRDVETGIGLVNLSLDHIDTKTNTRSSISFTAKETESCGEGGKLYVNDTWHLVNANSTRFPQGVWAAQFEVFDKAGNRIRVPVGNLILDHASPTVRVEAPILPAGQTAVKPGDQVKIRLLAEDAFGVDEGKITIDASAFAKDATALRTRPVRSDGIIYQEASFIVDRTDLANAAYDVTVRVPDLAGNATVVKVPVAVNVRPFEFVPGSLRVTNVTHNSLVLHWETNDNTSAQVLFGTTSIALSGRTVLDTNATTKHSVKVEGLQPSTHYFLRAVSSSTGGFKKESDTVEATTTTALFLTPVSPVTGGKVSGLVKVAFQGGLLDSLNFVTYTLEVRDGPSKPWTFVTTATRQGESHELLWNSTRFLDGTTYELRLTAEAGRDTATVVIGALTSDNTPPAVTVLSPLLATNVTTPRIVAETSDSLSGLGPAPARLLIDGVEASGEVLVESLPGERFRLTYNVPAPLAQGIRAFELRVADKAGNVARESWKVAIDSEAPKLTLHPLRYGPGTGAAKAGGTVTFNLSIADLSGVSFVSANTTELSTLQAETRLVKIVNTDTWQGTVPVTAADAGAVKSVLIHAVDLAGNTGELVVKVPVDNVAPDVKPTSLASVAHTRVVIDVSANEAIIVNGTATAPQSPAVTAATTLAQPKTQLTFEGLLPSRTYAFQLTVADLAGNEVPLAGTFATERDVIAPSTVGPLSVVDLLNGTLRLSWDKATDDVGVSHYRVYRSDDGVTFRVIAEVNKPTYDDAGLPYEKPYVYRVAAVDHGANEGPAEERLRVAATAVPRLTAGLAAPTVGTPSTPFRYTVTYVSPGGVPASYVRIIIDGVPQNMTLQSGDAKTGAVYVYETRLSPHKRDEPHTHAFEASDGRYTALFPEDGSLLRGPLVSGDALSGGDAGAFASFAQRVPLGGVAGFGLALAAAVAVAAVITRRKKEGSK